MPDSVKPITGSDVFELCIFKNGKPDYVGYYSDTQKAEEYIASHQKFDIFLTPHKLNPSLLQRASNTMQRADSRTNDSEVLGYKYLLIDLDPRQRLSDGQIVDRPRGVSSSDEEHSSALSLANEIIAKEGLTEENYYLIDSGNGAHIYIAIENGIQQRAIEAALNGLKVIYETDLVTVDETVCNPSRLMRAPGSINNKGATRRPCRYLHCPEHLIPVGFDFIAGLKVETATEPKPKTGIDIDLAEKIANDLGYSQKKAARMGTVYLLNKCPFCSSTDKGAVVGRIHGDGAYFFRCQHKRCKGKKWADLKEKVGLETGRLDRVRKVILEQGKEALENPDVQAEISKLKAAGDLDKLKDAAESVGIAYKALKAAARRPYAIAQDMADRWVVEHHIKTDRLNRRIYHYEDGVYVDAEDFIACLIDEKFRGINTTGFINNILDYIRRHSLYDFEDNWLAVANGLIDPDTLVRADFSPEIVTRRKLNLSYDPQAECPKFKQFVGECKTDETLLQEAGGYPLLPAYPWQKAIMLLGGGGQGKSVFLRILAEILSPENVSAASLQTLVDNRFGTNSLYGKLANIAGDISDMTLSNTATFKGLTGDDKIRAEEKGKPAYEFWNRAKLIFSANALPPSKDKSTGYFRRWILIDFNRPMVTDPNPRLAAELLEERSGIFNWMLEGAKRLNEKGFTYTKKPDEMASKYIERSEPIVKFIEECCTENFDKFETSKEVFAAYNIWARFNRKKRMSAKEFIAAMRNQTSYMIEYHRKGTPDEKYERPMGFSGIELTDKVKELKTNLETLSTS